MKSDVFTYELNKIKDVSIKNFTIEVLNSLPDYFYSCAASSSGRYHPSYALGEGGLVRHTKAAVRIALDLFDCHTIQNYNDLQKDVIISALLLHDGLKHGLEGSKFTVAEHPMVIADYIEEKFSDKLDKEVLEKIVGCIRSHMGQWNTKFKSTEEIMPKPKGSMQSFVHLCDYLASRKALEFNFDVHQ
ncbi:MAG: hypothetical protein PHX62_08790 [Bacilli bacterium]|nr:hypothetical protein [Bacilli bacterium]